MSISCAISPVGKPGMEKAGTMIGRRPFGCKESGP
jgi:hypothetical protein